jgi:tRNA A-37 threonylcarbamoyl transferase component Bud32/photosystem II stability/assembly factor-like uncharacterized protein
LLAFSLQFIACSKSDNAINEEEIADDSTDVWYKQADIELGSKIQMYSSSTGVAVSRGRGNIPGNAYKYENGKWISIFNFPYSDYPLIGQYDSTKIWVINHLTHTGHYKPVLTELSSNAKKEIDIPPVKWDETDFAMWKALSITKDGSAWLAGQQGNILFYNKKRWRAQSSPVNRDSLSNFLSGDINDLFMFDSKNGWGVGKDGLIIRCIESIWQKVASPTNNHLEKIWMANENFGWITGQNGTLLKFNGKKWEVQRIETADHLLSIKGIDSSYAIAVGANSSMFEYNGKIWKRNIDAVSIEDNFLDVDFVLESNHNQKTWIIGDNGIYTNSKTIGLSFTDFTSRASLRPNSRGGIFFNHGDHSAPDLLSLPSDGPAVIYENNGRGIFTEYKYNEDSSDPLRSFNFTAVADFNNDGENDIIQIYYADKFKVYLGSGNSFRDFSDKSNLSFEYFNPASLLSGSTSDFDNDGNIDLLIWNYDGRSYFFRNNGAAQFASLSDETGLPLNKKLPINTMLNGDFNNDGLTDIFLVYRIPVGNKYFSLYLNKGNFYFEEKTAAEFKSLNNLSLNSNSACTADFNNDGWLDVFVQNQQAPPILFINKGDASFDNQSERAGFNEIIFNPEPLNGCASACDVNNDGWMDLFASSKLFLNSKRMNFREVSQETGINFAGNPSFADIDNDGDNDLFVGISEAIGEKGNKCALYRNNLNRNNYLKVKLFPDVSNRSGAGVKLSLTGFDKKGNVISNEFCTSGCGSSPTLQNMNEVILALPQNIKYKLIVVFPGGNKLEYADVMRGSVLEVYESTFFKRLFALSSKSIQRTFLLINLPIEITKLLIILIIIGLLYFAAVKFGAKDVTGCYFIPVALLLIYFLIVHFTINEPWLISSAISFSVIPALGVSFIYTMKNYLEKKNAKFVSHYRIEEKIGEGGMGTVYKACDTITKKNVALKLMNPALLQDVENKKRFSGEGQLLSSFNHPNIVKVFETGETDDKFFIAMEFLEGGTLKELLQKNYPLNKLLIKKIMIQICAGLTEIHSQKVVHRDLKTNNIMLDSSGDIRIMDFGLSKSTLVSTMTSLGTVIGTLGYVAPEQVTNINSDHRTDIFSIGVIFYELLTNTLPFKGENEIALIHSIFNNTPPPPSSINNLVGNLEDEIAEKCLQKDPAQRYQSVKELIVELNKL